MSGLNATWIIPHDHAKHVEGTTFVRVPGSHNASLQKLVCEHNPLAEGMHLRSLASSHGLMELRMIRNKTQARELGAPASTLFAADSGTPRKARRMSRGALNTMRMISHSMEIEVPLVGNTHLIQVLKPVSAKEALYVEFEANTMSVVIQCLREFGFAPVDAMKLKPDGEKGIQRRKHGKFLVKKQLGKHKSQIWDAMQLQMENALERSLNQWLDKQANGDCNGEGAEDPAMDVENAGLGYGNGEGAGDPPVLPELEIHQKKNTKGTKTNQQKKTKWSMQQMFVHT